jgi:hypothetical protein
VVSNRAELVVSDGASEPMYGLMVVGATRRVVPSASWVFYGDLHVPVTNGTTEWLRAAAGTEALMFGGTGVTGQDTALARSGPGVLTINGSPITTGVVLDSVVGPLLERIAALEARLDGG